MSDNNYSVILKGYSKDQGEYYIEEAFAKLFKVSPEKARELLQSAPKTIKENLSKEQAEKYQQAIKSTGALCEVENMSFDTGGLSLE